MSLNSNLSPAEFAKQLLDFPLQKWQKELLLGVLNVNSPLLTSTNIAISRGRGTSRLKSGVYTTGTNGQLEKKAELPSGKISGWQLSVLIEDELVDLE